MKTSPYFTYVKNQFPDLADHSHELLSENLLSPFTVILPYSIKQQAEAVIHQLFALRENAEYQKTVIAQSPSLAQSDPGNYSICMSYDFHLDPSGHLKLIEINTNAAFLLMGHLLYQCQNLPLPFPEFTLDELKENILEEVQRNQNTLHCIGIVDEAPASQKLFFEFLLYEQLFKHWGYDTCIADAKDLQLQNNQLYYSQKKINFIYNRTTDFYLEQENLLALKTAYQNRSITLSPNPHEYALLADKQRLIEWSLALQDPHSPFAATLTPIKNNFLETTRLTETNSAALWSQKKKYFFKPLTSFGSKGTYRGEGISRVHFDQLINAKTLAQEFCPAPERVFEGTDLPPTKLKYDLRFYAYKNKIQSAVARLYQGQVTNLKTPWGGFAPILFSKD